ncbi:MAG: MFS transporter [Clostridia bacterium]|nr:MFS transporter [Clostridia bacterium]
MKTKQLTPEKLAKKQANKAKELKYWEKQKARPKGNTYFWYLVLIIALIYAVDEIASQIGSLMQTEIANDFIKSESAVTILGLLQVIAIPFQIIGIFYRPLADRFGRKTFLIINTFGMSLALFVIFLSQNIFMYFLGACLIMFFIPHDMHVVYIMETAPAKSRAITYSVVKFFANLAVMLVPFLRRWLMESAGQWRRVYFIPAVVGIVVSLIALFCARETDAFIESRIKYLNMTEEELQAEKLRKTAQDSQGGVIDALKFGFSHKQLRWVFICFALAGIGVVGSLNYQAILTHGYAQSIYGSNAKEFLDLVSVKEVSQALILYPIGMAISQVIMGFISDKKGRKAAAITVATNCVVSFVVFALGARMNFLTPEIIGFFCGTFVGSYYSTNDVLIMMASESAPTNLRSSATAAQTVVGFAGYAVGFITNMILALIFGDGVIGTVALCLLVPSFVITIIALIKKTHDTRGIDLETVTGTEWD